ncbi:hypothetical protein [Streptomyces sp. AV19]|nr:hypothetical protein [Streptomyces sp. AV19]MDG4534769.1 hypothetical protein [Streptomyces sp. AV19]
MIIIVAIVVIGGCPLFVEWLLQSPGAGHAAPTGPSAPLLRIRRG